MSENNSNRIHADLKTLARLFSKIKVSTTNFYKGVPCWEWQAGKDKDGYGKTVLNKKHWRVHRLFYTIFIQKIPSNLVSDHLCRVRNCVNPAHIEPVTQKVNTLRGEAVTAKNAQKINCPQGHPLNEDNLVNMKNGRMCKKCANAHSRRYHKLKDTPENREKNRQRVKEWTKLMKALPENDPRKIKWQESQRRSSAKWRQK